MRESRAKASRRPSSTRIGPDRRRTGRPIAEEAEHRHHRRPTRRVTRGVSFGRVSLASCSGPVQGRSSDLVVHSSLDVNFGSTARRRSRWRGRRAARDAARRAGFQDGRSASSGTGSRAAAPRTAIASCSAEHADDAGEAISLSRLPGRDDGCSSRCRRSSAFQRRCDRSRAARLREAARRRERSGGMRRPLGPRGRRVVHRSPVAHRHRGREAVSWDPLVAPRVASSSASRRGACAEDEREAGTHVGGAPRCSRCERSQTRA